MRENGDVELMTPQLISPSMVVGDLAAKVPMPTRRARGSRACSIQDATRPDAPASMPEEIPQYESAAELVMVMEKSWLDGKGVLRHAILDMPTNKKDRAKAWSQVGLEESLIKKNEASLQNMMQNIQSFCIIFCRLDSFLMMIVIL